jgi:hypothetical protein
MRPSQPGAPIPIDLLDDHAKDASRGGVQQRGKPPCRDHPAEYSPQWRCARSAYVQHAAAPSRLRTSRRCRLLETTGRGPFGTSRVMIGATGATGRSEMEAIARSARGVASRRMPHAAGPQLGEPTARHADAALQGPLPRSATASWVPACLRPSVPDRPAGPEDWGRAPSLASSLPCCRVVACSWSSPSDGLWARRSGTTRLLRADHALSCQPSPVR